MVRSRKKTVDPTTLQQLSTFDPTAAIVLSDEKVKRALTGKHLTIHVRRDAIACAVPWKHD
eukprot:1189924-Prorocentrum_minimum.AAC.4